MSRRAFKFPHTEALAALASRARGEPRRADLHWRQIGITAAAFVATTLVLVVRLHPSPERTARVAGCVLVSGVLSTLLGAATLWLIDHAIAGGVRVKLVTPILLTALVMTLNVVLLARLLFISSQDLGVLLAFLAFGITMAAVVASPIARHLTETIAHIESGARRIATGDYAYRIADDTPNEAPELVRLVQWYNQMAANLLNAVARQQAAETERRQVIAAISHDLRTPLASIQLLSDAIADEVVTDPATLRRYHRTIQAETSHMNDLLTDLFELAHLEAGSAVPAREPSDLRVIVDDAVAWARAPRGSQATAPRHIAACMDAALPQLPIDADWIARVLHNLLQNATEHTPESGAVLVHVAMPSDANGDPEVRVQVIDTGDGILAADLPHIFTPTYRSDPSRQRHAMPPNPTGATTHAGLGLAIAARIVDSHGGRMWGLSPLPEETRTLMADCLGDDDGDDDLSPPCGPGTVIGFTLPVQV
jgi:signal transduction histidine kinase